MKWFKHLTASRTDPDIGAIISEFGYKGYFLFFRTLEIIADEFDVKNPAEIDADFAWFLNQFPRNISKKTLINFLNFCQDSLNKKRLQYSINGKKIHLKFPKLKDLTDEYTRRNLESSQDNVRSNSGVTQELIRNKSGVTPLHKNKEVRIKNNTSPKKISDDDKRLTELLIKLMLENDPNSSVIKRQTKKQKEKWMDECRKLNKLDNRSYKVIEKVLRWCQQDDFWSGNILSMTKFREKFSQLYLKYKQSLDGKKETEEEQKQKQLEKYL